MLLQEVTVCIVYCTRAVSTSTSGAYNYSSYNDTIININYEIKSNYWHIKINVKVSALPSFYSKVAFKFVSGEMSSRKDTYACQVHVEKKINRSGAKPSKLSCFWWWRRLNFDAGYKIKWNRVTGQGEPPHGNLKGLLLQTKFYYNVPWVVSTLGPA